MNTLTKLLERLSQQYLEKEIPSEFKNDSFLTAKKIQQETPFSLSQEAGIDLYLTIEQHPDLKNYYASVTLTYHPFEDKSELWIYEETYDTARAVTDEILIHTISPFKTPVYAEKVRIVGGKELDSSTVLETHKTYQEVLERIDTALF